MDPLGESDTGDLVQIELQSQNDATMPFRMLEYRVQAFRAFGSFPRQIVLYVGDAPMRMDAGLTVDRLQSRYELVDVRDLDAGRRDASGQPGSER